jgi:hypothetical protein
MVFKADVFNVMIASPSDVQVERSFAREVINDWNAVNAITTRMLLQPVGWDSHSSPTMGDRPQAIINKQVLAASDLLVAIFWTRLGTPTKEAISGTVEEIDRHLQLGRPAMVYFSSAPVRLDSIDEEQYSALKEFRKDCAGRGLVETYDTPLDFRQKFTRQLGVQINTHDYFKGFMTESSIQSGLLSHSSNIPQVSKEAATLLLAASQDAHGHILSIRYLSGASVSTNGKEFLDEQDARSIALWQGAVQELAALDLIEDVGAKGEIYTLTRNGYNLADRLSKMT